MMISLQIIFLVLIPNVVTATCTANRWSTELSMVEQEASPSKPCHAINNEYECTVRNFCCFHNNVCRPSNVQMVECPSAMSKYACELLESTACWFDGMRCRRNCPNVLLEDGNAHCANVLQDMTASPTYAMPTLLPSLPSSMQLPTSTMPPSDSPVITISLQPSLHPSISSFRLLLPTANPTTTTLTPSNEPTIKPSTLVPTTSHPTRKTTLEPTKRPSKEPTTVPTKRPTSNPTFKPTKPQTSEPTKRPTSDPTPKPTKKVMEQPTKRPTSNPTPKPTKKVTAQPTKHPTSNPTAKPTKKQTVAPTLKSVVTRLPTLQPSASPSSSPTGLPTHLPTTEPTAAPSRAPTLNPTNLPSKTPTFPTLQPTKSPSENPTERPTHNPTVTPPTTLPTLVTLLPTNNPTLIPTAVPSQSPTVPETSTPTHIPTSTPSQHPTVKPTNSPTHTPTVTPSQHPTTKPTNSPTRVPTAVPSQSPTYTPGVHWAPGLALQERNPTTACKDFSTEQSCAFDNYCCWRDSVCFPPTKVAGVECALIQEESVCNVVWADNCMWNAFGACQRRVPSISEYLSPTQVCDDLYAANQVANKIRYAAFDSLATTVNETTQAAKSTAINANNQYCWNKAKNAACMFPFTYQTQAYNTCVDIAGAAKCMIASGTMEACTCTVSQRKRSVLMITLDDFRPEMNAAYGRKSTVTPIFDSLANRAGTVIMDRAYAQVAWCSPSRDSFLSSLLPDTTKSYSFAGNGLRDSPHRIKMKTLPQLFKEAGYWTAGGGKIFHLGRDDPDSWNEYYSTNVGQNAACVNDAKATRFKLFDGTRTRLACTTTKYDAVLDHAVMTGAISALERIVHQAREPFFLSVGLFKPHLPYHLYTPFWTKFADMPEHEDLSNMQAPSLHTSIVDYLTYDVTSSEVGESWGTNLFQNKTNNRAASYLRTLMRRGYQASVYQTDDMIGQILNKVEALGLSQSTLVVIHGDHGFGLGENNHLAKQTNFESDVRVPLLIHVPWFRAPSMTTTELCRNGEFFELLDLMPTIAGLMQIAKPRYYEGSDQSGQIAVAALQQHAQAQLLSNRKTAAFSQITRCALASCSHAEIHQFYAMGYSVRTENWRYTVYLPFINGVVNWDSPPLSQELYDHSDDDNTLLAYKASNGALYGQVEMFNLAESSPRVCSALFELISNKYRRNGNLFDS